MLRVRVVAETVFHAVFGVDDPVFAVLAVPAGEFFGFKERFYFSVPVRRDEDEVVLCAVQEQVEGVVVGVFPGVFDVPLDVMKRNFPPVADMPSFAFCGMAVVGE
jgi:hypothetical protein